MMENKAMMGLVGKDNRVWGFYDSIKDAEEALNQQNDPEWYRIEKVWTDDYFDMETGRLVNQRYVG